MAYYFYILQSGQDGSFYSGISKDPYDRLGKHNRPHKGYTARKQPWKLVAIKPFDNKTTALKYEKWVKTNKDTSLIKSIIAEYGVN